MNTPRPKRLKRIAALLLAASASLPASAHHSFAEFDDTRTVIVEGVVEEFRLVNPHAMMTVIATDADGRTTRWKVEFDGLTHLGRRGWTDETFKVGERLVLTGNPARSGSPFIFFNNAVREDGTELLRPHTASLNAIEEERRLRRLKRESQE
jgi:hypothetical protein